MNNKLKCEIAIIATIFVPVYLLTAIGIVLGWF